MNTLERHTKTPTVGHPQRLTHTLNFPKHLIAFTQTHVQGYTTASSRTNTQAHTKKHTPGAQNSRYNQTLAHPQTNSNGYLVRSCKILANNVYLARSCKTLANNVYLARCKIRKFISQESCKILQDNRQKNLVVLNLKTIRNGYLARVLQDGRLSCKTLANRTVILQDLARILQDLAR